MESEGAENSGVSNEREDIRQEASKEVVASVGKPSVNSEKAVQTNPDMEPSKHVNLDALINNLTVVSALLLGFTITLSASFKHDDFTAADARLVACTGQFLYFSHYVAFSFCEMAYRQFFESFCAGILHIAYFARIKHAPSMANKPSFLTALPIAACGPL